MRYAGPPRDSTLCVPPPPPPSLTSTTPPPPHPHPLSATSRDRRPAGLALHWAALSAALLVGGAVLHVTCQPFNKQLWSLSYNCLAAGACGATLTVSYLLVDAGFDVAAGSRLRQLAVGARLALRPLEVMGLNAIGVFVWHGAPRDSNRAPAAPRRT